jgi:hypothetical protein
MLVYLFQARGGARAASPRWFGSTRKTTHRSAGEEGADTLPFAVSLRQSECPRPAVRRHVDTPDPMLVWVQPGERRTALQVRRGADTLPFAATLTNCPAFRRHFDTLL